ncbi:MAG TPA: SDR family oxidoreductase [Acidimicrobiales bacterium]|nr:SDR family oxidoreductase [Acidimicrobiales bacterium]
MDLQLNGKRALVTGGSRGIGKAIARVLADEGCDVAIAARDRTRLDEAAAELRAGSGRMIFPVEVETGDDASVRAMVAQVREQLGGIDILVNNAARPGGGPGIPPKLADITDSAFYDDVNVKVMGYLRCAREVAPFMVENGWGRIINISGLAARLGGSIIGAVRNVSVAALTKVLADELGPSGINVTVVHPGATKTEAVIGAMESRAVSLGVPIDELEAQMAQRILVGRIITAEEVAWVVAFLASPRSISITGDAIVAGGGIAGSVHY